jgi:signal transduction histidine kinase
MAFPATAMQLGRCIYIAAEQQPFSKLICMDKEAAPVGAFDQRVPAPARQLLSTLAPTARQRQVALGMAAFSAVTFLVAAPFAKLPLPHVPGFLAVYQGAFFVFDLITAVLLFAQFRVTRSEALLWLASGYVFSALMSSAHSFSFPGLFATAGAFGGPQTTAWLYFLWHAAFPLFVVAYAFKKKGHSPGSGQDRHAIVRSVGTACGLAALMVLLAAQDVLPQIMVGHWDDHGKVVVAMFTWLSPIAALAQLWRARPHTVLDLWIMVVLCVWVADIGLAAMLNGSRFDLGWYTARIYGLFASAFVLGILLLENAVLYARLSEEHALLEQTTREKSEYAAALRVALDELEEANGDLRAFVGSLAHDLQQPITTIASFAQVLQRQPQGTPAARESHLARIISAADWAQRMIRALLDFARLGQADLRRESVDMNELVNEARIRVGASAEGRDIEWKIGPLPMVQADRSLLLLAFSNLLSNAVKYTRTTRHARICVEIAPHDAPGHAIRVRDNGVGFDMQQAGRLFTPFERLHRSEDFEGTGMGLANVRRIIEKHGGTISAQAQSGRGAEFTVVLR